MDAAWLPRQADSVTYHFFRARLMLLEAKFKEADRYLTFAFRNCDPNHKKNQRTILSYIIPVKLNLGLLPRVSPRCSWREVSLSSLIRTRGTRHPLW